MSMTNTINMFLRRCVADPHCTREASSFSHRCGYHSLLDNAPWLTPDDLADVIQQLQAMDVLTDHERKQIRRERSLRLAESDGLRAEKDRQRVIDRGITATDYDAAIARGRVNAKADTTATPHE